jgi:hypothetical protein
MLTQEWFFLSLKIHSSLSITYLWSSWKSCFLHLSLLNILLRFRILQRLDKLFSIRKPFGSFILRKIWVISKKYLSHTRIRRILLSFSPFLFSMAYCIALIFPISACLFIWAISLFRPFCHKLSYYFFLRSTKSTFLFFVFHGLLFRNCAFHWGWFMNLGLLLD